MPVIRGFSIDAIIRRLFGVWTYREDGLPFDNQSVVSFDRAESFAKYPEFEILFIIEIVHVRKDRSNLDGCSRNNVQRPVRRYRRRKRGRCLTFLLEANLHFILAQG